jgi:hypothetical protein
MTKLTRRGFLAATAAAGAVRFVPSGIGIAAKASRGRWIVKLVYDKGLGMMRAVERFVP